MELHLAQKQIASDVHRFRVVNCGRRFGKTTLAIWEMFGKAAIHPGSQVVYIAPTYQQARDIAWRELKKVAKPLAKSINEARLEITIKTNGEDSIILLRGWESVETLRGQRFDLIVIDEVAMMRNFWENWQEVLRPTLTDRQGHAMFISTPRGFNHFYDLYNLQGTDNDFKSFHFTSYDNPWLPVEELETAKKQSNFEQEYMADFRKMEGLVYKEFNRKEHVFEDIGFMHSQRRIVDTICGVDFGFTNPTAMVLLEVDQDKRYFVTHEWYKSGKTNDEVIEYAKTLGASTFYPDPAEPDRIEEMKRKGLQCREVSKDVEKGIDTVRNLLKQGRLKVHKDCINLISEFETYAYKDKKPMSNDPEEPIKEHDHALDALRYALHMKEPEPQVDALAQYRIIKNRNDSVSFK